MVWSDFVIPQKKPAPAAMAVNRPDPPELSGLQHWTSPFRVPLLLINPHTCFSPMANWLSLLSFEIRLTSQF
jgi:hypothetical protein